MQLQDIVSFCEGTLGADEFYKALLQDNAEELFKDSPAIPPYTKQPGMVYYYLIEQNYDSIGKLLNVQSCLVQFLQENGIRVNPSKDIESLYNLMLKAQPRWLTVPQNYLRLLLKDYKGTDAEKLRYLKEILLEKFRYMKKPPKWIQDAIWPIVDNQPLFFVGQIDISPLSHGKNQLFIFYDEKNKEFHHIAQSM